MARPLVVGYGNPLRGDDGVGWRVAEILSGDPRLAGTDILFRHQLTPELAEDVSRAARVVLVDARHGVPPGAIETSPVEVAPSPQARGAAAWSHALSPEGVVALAAELYGRAPAVSVVTVGAASFGAGDSLSPAVEVALAAAADAVVRALAG